jgi:hypothetical protein
MFEINVRWEALNRITWTYFLFSNEKVKLYLHNRELILEIDDYEKWSINIPYLSLDNSKNYSVLLIKDNGKIGILLSASHLTFISNIKSWLISNHSYFI